MNSVWLFNLGAEIYGWFTAQPTWRASCARLAERLDASGEATILDLGCGPGVSTFELAKQLPRARLIGLDVAPRMLAEARRRARYRNQDITWLLGDAAALPFASRSLDACTGHSFLYLVRDRQKTLAEIKRVLKPGGRLHLMEPNARGVTPRQVLRLSRDPRHLVSVTLWRPFSRLHGRYSPASLAQTLDSAGFTQCEAEEAFGGLGILASATAPA